MQTKPTILLIEDNGSIISALKEALRNEYDLEHASTGRQGIYYADRAGYDVIILDLSLPDVPGLAVCQQLRERGCTTPILILSGETKVLTKISLLDAGANDYLTKPFSLGELKARLRVLSRQYSVLEPRCLSYRLFDLALDSATHEVTRGGVVVPLRRKEFALLECLLIHAGHVVTREALTRHAWHGHDAPWTNTVDVHIKYLRDKIDRPFEHQLIKTVHGIGYRIQSPAPSVIAAGSTSGLAAISA